MSTTLITTPAKNLTSISSSDTQPKTPTSPSYQPSPGRFRHPRLTEIIERRSKISLTSRDVQNAAINAGALLLTFVLSDLLHAISATLASAAPLPEDLLDTSFFVVLIRIFLVVNIIYCLRPVIPYLAKTDNISDIPLTPTQRALLGLPPSTTASASAQGDVSSFFITPPRYRRNSGTSVATNSSSQASTSDRRSISANYSSSPLSASRRSLGFSSPGSSRTYRRSSGSFAYSPGGSPLLYKAVANNNNTSNTNLDFDISRSSFSTSTASGFGLSRSSSMRERRGGDLDTSIGPGTPSPTGRKTAGGAGGINYKWLYDKGGRLPKRDNMGF